MKIVTFNVNGIRARLHQLAALVEKHNPEVIGLQETKVHDDQFPHADIEALGYKAHIHGQKGHYGVAMLTRIDSENLLKGWPHDNDDAQKRMISLDVNFGDKPLRVFNGYFPQGESRDHPQKFPNKKKFYADLIEHLAENHNPDEQLLVIGDMNISPSDNDIGIGDENRKRWLRTGKCSFLPEEREWYQTLCDWGLSDAWREKNPDNSDIFSWFDYRSKGFDDTPKRGLRIDHILMTQPLSSAIKNISIDYDIRAMEKPSDHCPVILELG